MLVLVKKVPSLALLARPQGTREGTVGTSRGYFVT
jgi:hypothetical protein